MTLKVKVRILLENCSEGNAGTVIAEMDMYGKLGLKHSLLFASGADTVSIMDDNYRKVYDKAHRTDSGILVRELLYR